MVKMGFIRTVFSAATLLGFVSISNGQVGADGSPLKEEVSGEHVGAIYKTMNTVVCPPIAGVTCTLNGPSSSTYLGAPAGCNAGSFTGSNPWDGGSISGFVSWAFSSPISKVTLKSGSVNTNDYATISTSGGSGGTISINGLVCLSSLVGLKIGVFTGSCCGDVAWNVNSTGTFTFVNAANTGGASGWIAECPSFITAVLPIELLSFDGECNNGNTVNLKWKTISESENDFFTLERSKDAQSWEIVGKVKAAGNSTQILDYNFEDKQPLRGLSYYRLKQTDFNGKFEYSPYASVENCVTKELDFYPNPAGNELTIDGVTNEGTVVEVYNLIGLRLASISLSVGENKLNLSQFENGSYFFKVIDNNSDSRVQRVLINK